MAVVWMCDQCKRKVAGRGFVATSGQWLRPDGWKTKGVYDLCSKQCWDAFWKDDRLAADRTEALKPEALNKRPKLGVVRDGKALADINLPTDGEPPF